MYQPSSHLLSNFVTFEVTLIIHRKSNLSSYFFLDL
uniref:Uncharacterized protein n=1 Tax=Siphoviridae sp. ctnMb19 TaxID=2825659 RepID=A0A8S5NUE7_9CAUD|nr:MAG TPA: hypothetical protein [Siphoviridae sp. ctnMb19]DAL69879.1 MAG TPA: hypothetical protein [Bacteriophage sp.]DAP02843.1 MAG TPA: hypothetical protein [Caudoviricetes sp.]DAR08377.1 MAG TPA: hypothetical protein [Caudoviricetes sp.]DAX07413.1 MAG TPA: hypothetical protein [Bacteriophage sp.]